MLRCLLNLTGIKASWAAKHAGSWRRRPFALTASYDAGIAATLAALPLGGSPAVGEAGAFPAVLKIDYPLVTSLRYGENPHQAAALYTDSTGTGIAGAKQLQGKELSYNNLVDLDACWELSQEFDSTAVAIIKHTNPCGAATRQLGA